MIDPEAPYRFAKTVYGNLYHIVRESTGSVVGLGSRTVCHYYPRVGWNHPLLRGVDPAPIQTCDKCVKWLKTHTGWWVEEEKL